MTKLYKIKKQEQMFTAYSSPLMLFTGEYSLKLTHKFTVILLKSMCNLGSNAATNESLAYGTLLMNTTKQTSGTKQTMESFLKTQTEDGRQVMRTTRNEPSTAVGPSYSLYATQAGSTGIGYLIRWEDKWGI